MDIKDLRREYLHDGLTRQRLETNPLEQFKGWLDQAVSANLVDPTAMTLATVDADGQPSQRIVLLKQADDQGLVFYTNFSSKKGQDIQQNAKVSLHFAWLPLDRQVKIQGIASKLSAAESATYFHSRPRDSQLAAWCSQQSQVLASRRVLEGDFLGMQETYQHQDIPLPAFWGGYRVEATHYEFWQGRENRLHDCFSFSQQSDEQWQVDRLAP